MDLKELINNFWDYQKKNNIELYNEISFQHELGIYLRNNLPNYKIQFERNISYFFNNVKDTKKKEIDIVIFKDDFSEKYAIELKYPKNGQYPEQMFSFIKDIKFMEQAKCLDDLKEICKKFAKDDSVLKENEKALARNKKETDNIVNAIASGIINDALKERLDALTEEKNQLELENMKLQLKAKSKLTPEDALNFLHSMIDLDNNTEAYKKRLIQRFVKKVILYNDRMNIYLIAVNELEIDTVEPTPEDNNKERNNTNLIVGNGCLVLQCTLS